MREPAQALAEAIEKIGNGLIVAVTGAGVSAASGLPVFRGTDPNAIWARDVTEIATSAFFRHDPVAWWTWFRDRFGHLADARPNAAHLALAAIEEWHEARGGEFLLVTQNIDLLHEQASSRKIVKVHGTSDRLRCSRYGCRYGAPSGSIPIEEVANAVRLGDPEAGEIRPEDLPRCPECGSLLRPHALLFDEYYSEHRDYGVRRVEEALGRMDLTLFIGTSFSVGITDLALQVARSREIPAFSIDPAAAPPPGVIHIRGNAESVLPQVVAALRN